jgi:hypothetical protein
MAKLFARGKKLTRLRQRRLPDGFNAKIPLSAIIVDFGSIKSLEKVVKMIETMSVMASDRSMKRLWNPGRVSLII